MKWLLGAIVLLVLALALKLSLLVYTAYVLLAVLVLSRFIARSWVENLIATRECNRLTAQVGDKVAVNVVVENKGAWPVTWLLLEDLLPRGAIVQRPPRLRVLGRRLLLCGLKRQARKTLAYQVQFQMRGYYQIGPVVLESGDLFGLHRRYGVSAPPHFVLVYPKIVPLEGYNLASRRPIGEVRLTHRLYEDPTRIEGVRPYQPGDPFNRIHWRATARTTILHSKVYEPSAIVGATLVVDLHQNAFPTANEPLRSELVVTTAASLANAVYQMGQQVGLVTNGRDAVDRIRQQGWNREYRTRKLARQEGEMLAQSTRLEPLVVETRRGAEQLMRILEMLARAELTDGLPFADLVLESAHRIPRDATIVAVLPGASSETAMALGSLRRRGYAVSAVIVTFDPNDFTDSAARLMAEGIEARAVADEADLASLCRQRLVRSA